MDIDRSFTPNRGILSGEKPITDTILAGKKADCSTSAKWLCWFRRNSITLTTISK
jgi:hypothetical protein